MTSKLPLVFSLTALFFAGASLAVSLRTDRRIAAQVLADQEIDRRVDEAVARKERDFVSALQPKMEAMYQNMLKGTYKTPEKKPETLKELFEPLIQIIEKLS